ncbi:unnamed protein product [Echinostoma caproni]|uniref:Uncharacterized protein n=1 Tax=Echinostoma caproni TaxID=27848 RepID=A0A183BEV6_9TREM|nr:unnamed protein product [Echinostoma caproni]
MVSILSRATASRRFPRTTPITTVELPGSHSTVGITSSQVQEPGRPLAEA